MNPSDMQELAVLLYSAFRGTVDDTGETAAAAVREMEQTFAGAHGALLSDCSFVIEQSKTIAAACLVSWYEPTRCPFVTFSMTRPEYRRRGMARCVLARSINTLLDRGFSRLVLLVTDGNAPAQAFYASMGFTAVDESRLGG